jgi:hypothetical protein
MLEVARHGEESGHGVPCLLLAAKDDLDPYPVAVQDSVTVFIFSLATLFSHSQCCVYIICKLFPQICDSICSYLFFDKEDVLIIPIFNFPVLGLS